MKIVAISDTHELQDHINLPEGDLLLHTGDFTNKGSIGALKEFLTWFSSQPHKHKVFICGNHELGVDKGPDRQNKLNIIKSFNVHYLEDSWIEIEGYKIYGSPVTPYFYNWAWNVHRGDDIARVWAKIPDDTNILLTHGPPYGILDTVSNFFQRDIHQGCQNLIERIDNLKKLKLHVFGHLHLEGGNQITINDKIFANAAICDDSYKPVHKPIEIEL